MIQEPKHRRSFRNAWLWILPALLLMFVLVVLTKTDPGLALKAEAAASDRLQISSQEDAIAQLSTSETEATFTQAAAAANHLSPAIDPPSSDNCISCHTDKTQLKELAEEPEEVKSDEAEGEG